MNFNRVAPLFPPHRCHETHITDQPRTNNTSEGWKNKFHCLVGQDHPTVWKLIETLQREYSCISAILWQDKGGIQPKKRVKLEMCPEDTILSYKPL